MSWWHTGRHGRTYGLPVLITRARNNIGPRPAPGESGAADVDQRPQDQPLPVYGEGLQVRDRMYVEDHCEAIDTVLHKGSSG